MKLKQFVSTFVLGAIVTTAMPIKKAEAGIVVAISAFSVSAAGRAMADSGKGHYQLGNFLSETGVVFFMGGIAVMLGGIVTSNIGFIILSEDGNLSQDQLELALTEKYKTLADHGVVTDLAKKLKSKADSMKVDSEGKKYISLTENEVRDLLAPTDLNEDEIKQIVKDLK